MELIESPLDKLTPLQKKFIESINPGVSLKEAALKAGYAKNTAKNINTHIRLCPNLLNALKTYYINNSVSKLFDISSIEDKILTECLTDVNQVPKFKDTIKQIKQQAGVLQKDTDDKPNTQHITVNVQKFMQQINNQLTPKPIQNAEVVE